MTNSSRFPTPSRRALLLAAAAVSLACAPKRTPSLAALCSGGAATAHVSATIDTTRPPAGPELSAAKGTRFELTLSFAPQESRGAGSACTGATGTATFTGTLPARIRSATSAAGQASWRIDGETVFLDLNPG